MMRPLLSLLRTWQYSHSFLPCGTSTIRFRS